jgi:hypothetical protein
LYASMIMVGSTCPVGFPLKCLDVVPLKGSSAGSDESSELSGNSPKSREDPRDDGVCKSLKRRRQFSAILLNPFDLLCADERAAVRPVVMLVIMHGERRVVRRSHRDTNSTGLIQMLDVDSSDLDGFTRHFSEPFADQHQEWLAPCVGMTLSTLDHTNM